MKFQISEIIITISNRTLAQLLLTFELETIKVQMSFRKTQLHLNLVYSKSPLNYHANKTYSYLHNLNIRYEYRTLGEIIDSLFYKTTRL